MKFNINQVYIAIEGATGTGKHLLCDILQEELSAKYLKDDYLDNLFILDFYNSPAQYDLTVQLAFLAQRVKLHRGFSYDSLLERTVVANHIIEKDRIYAHLNLTDDKKLKLYNNFADLLALKLEKPDLVIYLRPLDPKMLYNRVKERGRLFEEEITDEYTESLCKAYDYFFDRAKDHNVLTFTLSKGYLTEEDALKIVEIIKKEDIFEKHIEI